MSAFLTLQVQGQPQVEATLQALHGALDTRQILDEGAAVLWNRMRTRFLKELDPMGERWIPSHASLRRKKSGRGGGTLFDTGKLFRSLQLFSEGANARSIGTNVTSNTGYRYPVAHQYGLFGNIRRQFLGFGDEDVVLMSSVIIDRLKTALKT